MVKRKSSPKKDVKKIHVELTYFSSILWGVFLLFLLAWVFVLGIFVGRGFLPGNVTILSDMKANMRKLYQLVTHDRSGDLNAAGKRYESDPKLVFYEKLSNKKDDVRKKWRPESKDENHGTGAAESITEVSQPAPPERKKIPKVKIPEGQPGPASNGYQYTLQLVSFSDGVKARQMIRELTDRGYPAYSYEARVKGKTYYRVRCGRFINREDAKKYAEKLEKEGGIKGFVSKLE